jgi:hypothetical protein
MAVQQPIYITWLNHLGGFEYFLFTSKNEYHLDIEASGETNQNIFPAWPKSYGETADTIKKQTFRESREAIFVKSQHLTVNQRDALMTIKTSPVVQIIVTRTDRRTVLVDTDSFVRYNEADDLFSIQFKIRYTNLVPSQRL